MIYERLPSFVLGFHGCDHSVAEKVLSGNTPLLASTNDYDWLDHGIYFWENNPERALQYATFLSQNPLRSKATIKRPAVIGAVLDLGLCLNLLDAQFIRMLKKSYHELKAVLEESGDPLPTNKSVGGSVDLLLRHLDCTVIEWLHEANRERGLPSFDSTRGAFIEGPPIYPNAGVHEFNHIQICIRNPRSVKGYFRVLPEIPD